MKKLLLVLGMITCMATVTACGGEVAEADFEPTVTEEDVQQIVESYVSSLDDIVKQNQQDYFKKDPVIAPAIESFESALKDLGELESTGKITFEEDEDGLKIHAVIQGSKRPGTFDISFDDEYQLISISTNVTYSFAENMKKAGLNTLMGMGTVFAVLILISLIISLFSLIPKIQAKFAKKEKKAEASVTNAVSQIEKNEAAQEDDTELIAVIAAAIAASEGSASADNYVVRSLRRIR